VQVKVGARPEELRQASQHTLFVEGQSASFDPLVLTELLPPEVRIEPLGPSHSIRSVAEAIFPYHPTYYFLIDRDHFDDATVENSWSRFPDPAVSNILIWRRRELENYFIDPHYIIRSSYCRCAEEILRSCIKRTCERRLFMDAANIVITELRERSKRKWISLFDRPADFPDREQSLVQLTSRLEYQTWSQEMSQVMAKEALSRQFEETLNVLMGGKQELEFDSGSWLERTRGKEILPTAW
jgi:hypothetical protein